MTSTEQQRQSIDDAVAYAERATPDLSISQHPGEPPKARKPEHEVDAEMQSWREAADAAEIEPYRPALLPSTEAWSQITAMADALSRAVALPKALRGKPADIALVILTGRDIGLKATPALNKIHVIEGRPSLSSEIMRALVLDRGHVIKPVVLSPTTVVMLGRRKGERDTCPVCDGKGRANDAYCERCFGSGEGGTFCEWSIDRAAETKYSEWSGSEGNRRKVEKSLADKDVWKSYPQAMLTARATSELCRLIFPDVLAGISYTPEELDADVDESGSPRRIDSTSTVDEPEPASDDDRMALREHIANTDEATRALIAERWREARLRSVRADAEHPLLADDVPRAWRVVAQAQAEAGHTTAQPPQAEPVAHVDTDVEPAPQTATEPLSDGFDAEVAALSTSKVMSRLIDLGATEIPTSDANMRVELASMLRARVICGTCGAVQDGPHSKDEPVCACDV